MEKLSDVFSYALSHFYKPASPGLLSGRGMCCTLGSMNRRKLVPSPLLREARDYIGDLFDELQTTMQIEDDEMFTWLYEPLESFKGYDVNDLQYLVWQAMIDKLRSEGR